MSEPVSMTGSPTESLTASPPQRQLAGRFPSVEAALECAESLLAPCTQSTSRPEPSRLDAVITIAGLHTVVATLQAAQWGRLAAITGLDLAAPPVAAKAPRAPARPPGAAATPAEPPTTDLEVLYHFCAGAAVLTLRVRVPRSQPELPTIRGLVPYAGMYESELSELFGITIVGALNRDYLILPDDWPNDVYPLRKDAVLPKPPDYLHNT
jgi:NADH:ubiquinone oxidoreductase subunit C